MKIFQDGLRHPQMLEELKFEVWQHPAYSPDLSPCDYFLFGPMKDELRGKHFPNDEAVKKVVQDFLMHKTKTFFLQAIQKLVERWTKCIEKDGDYTEK